MNDNVDLNEITHECLMMYNKLAGALTKLERALDEKIEETVSEYNLTKKNGYPEIERCHIEIRHDFFDQVFHYLTAIIVAFSPVGTPAVSSDQEADVIDNFFKKILKKHLPDQVDLKIKGHIQMFITTPNPFRK